MNRTDRIYLAVHFFLTLLVVARHEHLPPWPGYVAWNLCSMAAIVLLARMQGRGQVWEFAHDWLPAVFFVTVFEQVSFLSLTMRSGWQNPVLIAFETHVFGASPMEWMHAHARNWL